MGTIKIRVKEIEKLVDASVYLSINESYAEIIDMNGIDLLTHNRFDIAFKLFYLAFRDVNKSLSEELYLSHISAFTLDKFKEPDNSAKNSKESFIQMFDELMESIKKNGFDAKKSLVPLSVESSILNGAHRTAISIHLGKSVKVINTNNKTPNYNHDFFYKRGVPENFLDVAAYQFIQKSNNCFVALIWPVAKEKEKEIKSILGKVVYFKEVKLNPNGAHNLMSEVYSGESWLGNIKNNFAGTIGKSSKCFDFKNPLRVFVFQDNNLADVLIKKDKIRELFKIGKHSVHITDTKDEAILLSQYLLNENSIHFLNYAKPNTFVEFHNKFNLFNERLKEKKISIENIVLDGSIVLGAYGLRSPSDIDYISFDKYDDLDNNLIKSHNSYLHFYEKKLDDLIFNPINYFYFKGVKFNSLNNTFKFKKNRNETKDILDIKLIDAYLSNDLKSVLKQKRKQKYFLIKQKVKYFPISLGIFLLKKLNLYSRIRSIYHQIKS